MRKPVFPRIVRLLLIYLGIFTVLVMIQFAKRGSFTQKAGHFVVSGQHRLPDEGEPPVASNEYLLAGDVHVFFGGMDFSMSSENDGISINLTGDDGFRTEALPERMLIADNAVLFTFPGGAELNFTTHYSGGAVEMLISGAFPDGINGIELPFKPLRKTSIRDTGDGQFIASADGVNYTFGRSPMNTGTRTLLISAGSVPISYRAIPERRTFSPDDYVLSRARSAETFNEALTRWRDQNFSYWSRIIPEQTNEDVVVAFGGEALVRGTYRAGIASVSPAFLSGSARTYESSVYLGDLEQALRSLSAREREKIARLSRQINEKSLEFLKEYRVFEYFAVRGLFNFFDAGADLVRTIDPATLALDITPGILEGYMDWKTFRYHTDNPFERLVDQACFVISESIRTSAGNGGEEEDRLFVFFGSHGDTDFNLRLGKALLAYAEAAADSGPNSARFGAWAGIGRSLILSALSLGDTAGTATAGLIISPDGEISDNTDQPSLTTARLYRILHPAALYPRAVPIGAAVNGIWTWTAAEAVSASQENNVLDIAVSFPAGETHYMIIRGVRPFTKLQLYNMDFRTDPQFERYDSSGWSYNTQEHTLIVKMKHRATVEHIRIFY